MNFPTYDDVLRAQELIRPLRRLTPTVFNTWLNRQLGAKVFLKYEHLQRTGSFKIRGAANAILNLDSTVPSVVTQSSGNHGAAVANVARQVGIPSYVIYPKSTTSIKRTNMLRYGAELISCESNLTSREQVLEEFLQNNNSVYIPPYDHEHVIAGQGTVALELIERHKIDQIWVPVGGGGLASGSVLAADGKVEVICAEPESVNDAYMSMRDGVRHPPTENKTVADGLRTSLGELNFDILHTAKVKVALTSEDQIYDALRWCWQVLKTVVEPSAAVVIAAMLNNRDLVQGRVGAVLTGGNIKFPWGNPARQQTSEP